MKVFKYELIIDKEVKFTTNSRDEVFRVFKETKALKKTITRTVQR